MQSISQRAEHKAHLLGIGLTEDHDKEILQRIESITSKEIKDAANRYLKTADAISMLRPPDLVSLDEVGVIIGIRPNNLLEVKFRRGNFLIPSERLKIVGADD